MPSNNTNSEIELAVLADRYRTMRFVIPDDHSPLSEESEATLAALRQQAAERLHREVAEEIFYPREYMNSWGSWTDDRGAEPAPPPEPTPMPRPGSVTIIDNRRPASARQAFTQEKALALMAEQGYGDYKIVLEIPAPYADNNFVGVLECVRENPGHTTPERRYFTFTRRSSDRLQIQAIFTESEYVTQLRRRNGDVSHFYKAQADGRRRMVAKVLAGGADEYQLLIPAVVDDGVLRDNLTTKEYRRLMAQPEQRIAAARSRMNKVRRDRADRARSESQAAPLPETERGRRAQNAVRRHGDGIPRSRSARMARVESPLDFSLQSDTLE